MNVLNFGRRDGKVETMKGKGRMEKTEGENTKISFHPLFSMEGKKEGKQTIIVYFLLIINLHNYILLKMVLLI